MLISGVNCTISVPSRAAISSVEEARYYERSEGEESKMDSEEIKML